MRKVLVLILMTFTSATLCLVQEPSVSINEMSSNIGYDNPEDGVKGWPQRQERVASMLGFHEADLLGLWEVLRGQLGEPAQLLQAFQWTGVGRNVGESARECSPIFYQSQRFEPVKTSTFWLSKDRQDVVSKRWDTALSRIAK